MIISTKAEASSSQHQNKNQKIKNPSKYAFHLLEILLGIEVERDILGCVESLTYLEHDGRNIAKFPKFGHDKSMKHTLHPLIFVVFEDKNLALVLKIFGILRLLDIPHFGRSQ